VDLFGDHSVQALATMLQLALVVGSALWLVVLSVQWVRAAADRRPVPALVPTRAGFLARPGDDFPSSLRLRTCLPARAPPPDWEPLAPPADRRRQPAGSRLHRPGPAQPDGDSPQG
jgi:hypothetical protein